MDNLITGCLGISQWSYEETSGIYELGEILSNAHPTTDSLLRVFKTGLYILLSRITEKMFNNIEIKVTRLSSSAQWGITFAII